MKEILRTESGDQTAWEGVGVWIGVVKGGSVAEVQFNYGYHEAGDLRDMANALNAAANALDNSPTSEILQVMEAIRYLETFKTDLIVTANDQQLTIPAGTSISTTLIALAEAVRDQEEAK